MLFCLIVVILVSCDQLVKINYNSSAMFFLSILLNSPIGLESWIISRKLQIEISRTEMCVRACVCARAYVCVCFLRNCFHNRPLYYSRKKTIKEQQRQHFHVNPINNEKIETGTTLLHIFVYHCLPVFQIRINFLSTNKHNHLIKRKYCLLSPCELCLHSYEK